MPLSCLKTCSPHRSRQVRVACFVSRGSCLEFLYAVTYLYMGHAEYVPRLIHIRHASFMCKNILTTQISSGSWCIEFTCSMTLFHMSTTHSYMTCPFSCVKTCSPHRSRQVLGASNLHWLWLIWHVPRLIHIWHASFMCKKHAHHVYLVRFLVRFTRVYIVSWCTWFFVRICQNMTMKVAKTHRMTYLWRAAARCTTPTLPCAIRVGQTRRKNIR